MNSTEHYNRTCKANRRNATTKNGFSSPPLISGYKVASTYLIPTINNKGMKRKENDSFAVFYKNAAPMPEAVAKIRYFCVSSIKRFD